MSTAHSETNAPMDKTDCRAVVPSWPNLSFAPTEPGSTVPASEWCKTINRTPGHACPMYHLRRATAADLALTYDITDEAMREHIVATFGLWDDAEQQRKHRANFTPETYRIAMQAGVGVGLLAVEDEPEFVWLVKLYLKRSAQGAGLGTALLRLVIAEADAIGKPVRLRVLRVNQGAQRLYLRHGFRVVGEDPERLFMVREASENAAI